MSSVVLEVLRRSPDPAIQRLVGVQAADVTRSPRVLTLLQFPTAVHPYKKWWGTHWRLVALSDLGMTAGAPALQPGVDQELDWLTSAAHRTSIQSVNGLVRRCASQEGNAVYAASRLGWERDPRVRQLVDSLLDWQWPDGGWNCDVNASGGRSSFHETVTPALGLAAFHRLTGDREALSAAHRSAELLLQHKLYRSRRSGEIVHPSWVQLHYPAYWHYDVLQGLRLLQALGRLGDPRAGEALGRVEASRRPNGFFSGPAWQSKTQPDAVSWGKGAANEVLNFLTESVLHAAGRS